MIFDDVGGNEPVINEYFCRGRYSNCNMIYLKQNILSADRRNVGENCNLYLFSLNKEVELPRLNIMISSIEQNLDMMILVIYVKGYGKSLKNTSSLINLKTEILTEN